ncbi:MAG TPA: carboxypeptidase regulatory-like domain-containing protein, partial [Terriglobales bacterium]|nr:carboxypeptidase regulatory-like domain-containing protein [Terriglobales bacterium]
MSARPYLRQLGAASLFFWLVLASLTTFAQTSTSGLLAGVVTDPSGAVIPGVTVTLKQTATNVTSQVTTDSVGHYVFPVVYPGDYMLTFTGGGFQNAEVPQVHVEVQKSYNVNMAMQVGKSTETVQVTDIAGVELQTTSATVGTVLGGNSLESLPTFTRSASSLMFLQPAVSPDGMISGARREQVTFSFDGGDVTSDLEGSNSYASPPGEPSPSPSVPIPLESTQEFQVSTANPNATFGRSSGGQVSLVTKRGGNAFHGSLYEYNNNDGLNANSWTNNLIGLHKPHSVDNRFGGTIGGPIKKDKLWFFANYEGRRLHSPSNFSFVVPSETMKTGVLRFRNASGTVVNYSLQPGSITTACGGASCDPRNVGASPVVLSQLALYPVGNDSSLGDGLNTTGFTFNASTPTIQDLGVLRLDYKINDKWSAFFTGHYSNTDRVSTSQVSLLGTPGPVSADPIKPQFYSFEVTGQLTSNLIAVTHGSWLRNWWGWVRQPPTPLVSGTQTALVLAGEGSGNNNGTGKLLADPVNLATQAARYRVSDGKKYYLAEDLSLVHNSHLFQFGGSWYLNHDYFLKSDNFAGGLTAGPLLYVESTGNGSGEFMKMSSAYQPSTIQASDLLRWNELYSTMLGLVDRSSQVITRDGNFQPYPLGTPAYSRTSIGAYNAYFQDIWKARPSLTLTLGLNWSVQPNPKEANGKYDLLVDPTTNLPISYWKYFEQ